ncbi:hyaluronan and proteoglycan link protein 3-like [Engraulis encrasicolus]|uniref:hyaluronan and proteoglycan link protein 3-like n=1 Tax=Engraulis encrasicolus TaxID=184585 RepID=UPI002FD5B2E6
MAKMRLLLVALLQLLDRCHTVPRFSNGFLYHDIFNNNGNGEISYNGVQLHVASDQTSVFTSRGGNVTLPCRYWYEPPLSSPRRTRVKWSWQPITGGQESDVLVAIGNRLRTFDRFHNRVHLREDSVGDVSLEIVGLHLNDSGRYRCEVIDGLEDQSVPIDLELRGVVFPYQPHHGRYRLTFSMAQQACEEQEAVMATFEQLYTAWEEGLDWCNAGWLADGTVQYPITLPRLPCGGWGLAPGLRSYGPRHKHAHRYDAFCFSSSLKGKVYYLQHPHKLNFSEATQACGDDAAHMAKVGQLYAAWKFTGLDQCDAGWLADGSVRYPITNPRPNCGPMEAGVRSFGFPAPRHKHGVYCYKAEPKPFGEEIVTA